VFARALQRDPALRYPTAREFGEALAAAVAGAARPWTASEIGDFVRRTFATELRRRGAAVGTVLRDDQARTTVPILAFDPDGGGDTDDGGDDFPSVDSGHALPLTTGSDPSAGPLTELAPAPVGLGATPKLKLPNDSVVIQLPPSRRAVLWPLFAVAIVAVGAVALWLMWKQIRSQQQSAGGIVIVDRGGVQASGSGVVVQPGSAGSGSPAIGSAAVGSGSGSATVTAPPRKDRDKVPSTDHEIMARIKGRVADRLDAINACQREHPGSVPSKLALSVKASGKAAARVEPAAVNAAPLGACIRKVAEAIDYGKLARDADLTIQLLQPK